MLANWKVEELGTEPPSLYVRRSFGKIMNFKTTPNVSLVCEYVVENVP